MLRNTFSILVPYHIQNCVRPKAQLEILQDDPDKPLDLDGVQLPEEIHQNSLDALAAVAGLGCDDVV